MSANKKYQSAFITGKKAALHFSPVPYGRQAQEITMVYMGAYMLVHVCDCLHSDLGIKWEKISEQIKFLCHENRCPAMEMDLG